MRFMATFVAWLGLFPVLASCAHSSTGPQSGNVVSIEEFIQSSGPMTDSDVVIRGRIFPAAAHSVFLARPNYRLEGDSKIPFPSDCIDVLATADQFESLKAVAGRDVELRGKRVVVRRDSDHLAVYYRVRGRTTHLFCQDGRTNIPVIYLEDWKLRP